jgi:signal transduction histidine kinase
MLDAGTTTLYVEDRGPGIASIAQSSGSGLGLFIARRLMVSQAGSLKVGARPGGGTSFALSLPSSLAGSSERFPRVARQPAVAR